MKSKILVNKLASQAIPLKSTPTFKKNLMLDCHSNIETWFFYLHSTTFLLLIAFLTMTLNCSAVMAEGGVIFNDIASETDSGIVFERSPTPALTSAVEAKIEQGVFVLPDDLGSSPSKPNGGPGVAILDYDRDGDQDIYVTNGPDTENSLFKNLLNETGELIFEDVAVMAGVSAKNQDSTGVCYGDTDNDGDYDLYVMGRSEPNKLFENQGNGQFIDITEKASVEAGYFGSASCSMGDVNGDGLLDITIANSYDWTHSFAIYTHPYDFNEHNQLFINQGDNLFSDNSFTSGIQQLDYPVESGAPPDAAGLSWGIAMVDIDMDGDIDIVTADDQGGIPAAKHNGVDRGFIRIFENDGLGDFEDVTRESGLFKHGAWMGLSFADLNCDGQLDIFATNLGDYLNPTASLPYVVGDESSRWLLGNSDGTFSDFGVGSLGATPFGWGNSIFDYDNDGDSDIVFHGGLNLAVFVDASNPGVVLQNQDCSASFKKDTDVASTTNHSRRNVLGVATGDLNNDGFLDIVSVSNFDTPEPNPLILAPPAGSDIFDPTAFIVPSWSPTDVPNVLSPTPGIAFSNGSVSVEINSGDNMNHWTRVSLLGTKGLTTNGVSNRDGIGAVVKFTPRNGNSVMQPVVSGSSHASQHSLDLIFGMGSTSHGTIEVLWPGGTRNRLYNVRASEHIVFPEIPCSYDVEWERSWKYLQCVRKALKEIRNTRKISRSQYYQFLFSAMRAYFEEKYSHAPTT